MTVIAVWFFDRQLTAGASLEEARNAVLLMIVLYQNAFLLGLRHLRHPFWQWSDRENPFLFMGLTLALVLQTAAMLSPVGQQILGVGPVSLQTLAICLGSAVLILLINEIAKYFANRLEDSGHSPSETALRAT